MSKKGQSPRPFPVTTPPPLAGTAEDTAAESRTPPAVVEEPTPPPVKAEGVMAKNISVTWFRQPSTGTKIDVGETKLLKDDGWLAAQIEAKFLTKAKT